MRTIPPDRLLKEGRVFSVNVLKKGQLVPGPPLRPARPRRQIGFDGLDERSHRPPSLREGMAWFECKIVDEHPAGDHLLVVGGVIDGKVIHFGS